MLTRSINEMNHNTKSGGKRRTSSFQMSLRYSALEKVSTVLISFVVGDAASTETEPEVSSTAMAEPEGFSPAIAEPDSITVFGVDRCACW
jgi:hypothetical protein